MNIEDMIQDSTKDSPVSFCVMGSNTAGKSHLALTISEQYPENLAEVSPEKPRYIEDVGVIQLDDGAYQGPTSKGLIVRNILNIPRLKSEGHFLKKSGDTSVLDWPRAFDAALKSMELFKKRGCRAIVWDTGSVLDDELLAYLKPISVNDKGREDSFSLERNLKNAHQSVRQRTAELGLHPIFNFHTKAKEVSDDMDKAKATAAGHLIVGSTLILHRLYYAQHSSIYMDNVTLNAFLVKEKEIDPKTKAAIRKLYFNNKNNSATKNRLEGIVNDIEDAHLGKLLKKITVNKTT